MTLDQALDAIAEANGFTSVRVGRMPVGGRIVRTADVYYDGHNNDGHPLSTGHSDDSIEDALRRAIAASVKNRMPPAVSEPLPALEMAA